MWCVVRCGRGCQACACRMQDRSACRARSRGVCGVPAVLSSSGECAAAAPSVHQPLLLPAEVRRRWDAKDANVLTTAASTCCGAHQWRGAARRGEHSPGWLAHCPSSPVSPLALASRNSAGQQDDAEDGLKRLDYVRRQNRCERAHHGHRRRPARRRRAPLRRAESSTLFSARAPEHLTAQMSSASRIVCNHARWQYAHSLDAATP